MFRVSTDAYNELGKELEEAYKKAKDNLDDVSNVIRFNMLVFIDCSIRDIINEKIHVMRDEGIL